MLNKNRKGQLFTFLLAISTIVILSMALFYLTQKSGEFNHVLGAQAYATSKLYYENNKILIFLESLAQQDLAESFKALAEIRADQGCGVIQDIPYWMNKEGKNCVPDFYELIQSRFSAVFRNHLVLVDTARQYKESLFDYYSQDQAQEKSLYLQGVFENQIDYQITTFQDRMVATAKKPYVLQFRDVQQANERIALLKQFPNFNLDPPVNTKVLKGLNDLPEDLRAQCNQVPTSGLADCISRRINIYGQQGIVSFSSRIAELRTAIITASFTIPGVDQFSVSFAVDIPDSGNYRVFLDSVEYKGNVVSAFYYDSEESIIINGSARVSQLSNVVIEICMLEKSEGGKLSREPACPGNLKIFENKEFTSNTQGSISEDQTRLQFTFDWTPDIPKLENRFDFFLNLRSDVGTESEHNIRTIRSVLVSR